MSNPTLLLDGDHILHRSCAAVEKEEVWADVLPFTDPPTQPFGPAEPEDIHLLFSDYDEAWYNVVAAINRIKEQLGSNTVVVCLSDPPYFRHDLFPAYKGGRSRKPLCFARCRAQLGENYRVLSFPRLEADDVMGILGSRHYLTSIICSEDKDMKTVPATVYNGKDVKRYTEAEADYWHLFQTLTGDTSDGYPGCPGMGPVKAEKLLNACTEWEDGGKSANAYPMWPAVVGAFEKAGLTEEDALLQARLARILRNTDWDAEKKAPILWTPTS